MIELNKPRARFHSMEQSTQEDWGIIRQSMEPFIDALPDRLLTHLKLLKGDSGGFAVDRLEHCLQAATLAMNDGRDEEYVVCALLHDVGDLLSPLNHAEIAASILQPYVSEQNYWMVQNHGVFQGYYFFHHLGVDRNLRDRFRQHPWFEYTAEFCSKYDGPAFDPDFKSAPLNEFEPLLRSVFAAVKQSIYVPNVKLCAA